MHFFLAKWVQNGHRALHSIPECHIYSKCHIKLKIEFLAFKRCIGAVNRVGGTSALFGVIMARDDLLQNVLRIS